MSSSFKKYSKQFGCNNKPGIIGKYYYVYRITNKVVGKHYYGSRVSDIPPIEDLGIRYFSSSFDSVFMEDQSRDPDNFKYKVVKVLKDNYSKILFESFLHKKFEVKDNEKFYNRTNQLPNGFDCTGIKRSLKTRKIMSDIAKSRTKEENMFRGIKHIGKVVSQDTREKQRIVNTGAGNPFAKLILIKNAEGVTVKECVGSIKQCCNDLGISYPSIKNTNINNRLYIKLDGTISKNMKYNRKQFIGWYLERY